VAIGPTVEKLWIFELIVVLKKLENISTFILTVANGIGHTSTYKDLL